MHCSLFSASLNHPEKGKAIMVNTSEQMNYEAGQHYTYISTSIGWAQALTIIVVMRVELIHAVCIGFDTSTKSCEEIKSN